MTCYLTLLVMAEHVSVFILCFLSIMNAHGSEKVPFVRGDIRSRFRYAEPLFSRGFRAFFVDFHLVKFEARLGGPCKGQSLLNAPSAAPETRWTEQGAVSFECPECRTRDTTYVYIVWRVQCNID